MKKLTCLVIGIGLLFSTTACSGSKVSDNALDSLETTIQNFADMKSADYKMDLAMQQTDANVSINVHGGYNLETASPQLSLIVDMASNGQKVDSFMTVYVDKDNVYTNMMNIQKAKTSLSDAMGGTALPSISLDKETMKIPKEELKKYLKEASIKGDVLTLVFDEAKLNEQVKKTAANTEVKEVASSTVIKELKVVATLKDKKLNKADITFSATASIEGAAQEIKGTLTLTFTNVGAKKNIVFPKDLSTYENEKVYNQ